MIIVLDTNVIVSGLINPHGIPGQILRLIADEKISVCYDIRILEEYKEVLVRPEFHISLDSIMDLIEAIEDQGHAIAAIPLKESLPDPNDQAFLEVAISSGIEFLVTGNIKDYPESMRGSVNVISPWEFWEIYRKTAS